MEKQNPLEDFLDYGFSFYPQNEDSKPFYSKRSKWKTEENRRENFLKNKDELRIAWKDGCKKFAIIPREKDFVCFDIDRKNGKDGLLYFYDFLLKNDVILTFDINEHRSYVKSPNNGIHLYFKYKGKKIFKSCSICKGVEIKHDSLLTAPGSLKEKKEYSFYGTLEDAPELPFVLERLLPIKEKIEAKKKYFFYKNLNLDKKQNLDSILNYIEGKKGLSPIDGQRNDFTCSFIGSAKIRGFSKEKTENYLISLMPEYESEIRVKIKSLFR